MIPSIQAYFNSVVQNILHKTSLAASITIADHNLIPGHEEALGIATFTWSESSQKHLFDYITIDQYFVENCYDEHIKATPYAHHIRKLAGDTLEGTICHELAHIKTRYHCKSHKKETQRLMSLLSTSPPIR